MLRGLYSAGSGLTALLQKQEIETNNLVNAETAGYKRQQTVFKNFRDVLIDEINYREASLNKPSIGSISHGVMVDDVITIYEQGILVATQNKLDLALDGDGYFTIIDKDGKEYYTRDGGFKLNFEGTLVNNNGLIVAGEKGSINLQGEFISFEPDGSVYLDGEFVDRLRLVNLEEPIKIGSNRFLPVGESPQPFDYRKGRLIQGYIEQSNANVIDSMTRFIALTRSYESSQKVIQTIDNTLEKAINEVGRV